MSVAGFMNVHPHFNPEEAAHAAIEFVSSLDNLPAEVNFLLGEITEKDEKINNLLARIHQRHYGLTKNVKHLASQPPSGTSTPTGAFTLPIPPGSPLPLGHMTSKDQQTMQKIQSEWAKVEQLQMDKITLATRLESLISRARERGQAEWRKVGGMDLDEIEKQDGRTIFGEMGGAEVLLPSGGLGSGSDGRPQKKKRPNALPLPMPNSTLPLVVHPPQSSMPPPPAPRPSLSSRASSRHGRQISTSTLSEDPDADGEADDGGDGDADNMIYCFCQKKSYGEMIGCDNEACEFEWFHVTCVSMQDQPLPETWYCPVCVKALGMISSDGTRPGPGGQRGQKARRK